MKWLYECRMVASVSIIYPHDCVAHWELQLAASAQHHEYLTALSLA